MASDQFTIQIAGLKEFRGAMKQVDAGAPKALKAGFNKAAQIVAAEARRNTPARTGRAASSIRVASNTTAAQVRAGGAAAPYFGFLDYGNKVHSGRGVGRRDSNPRTFIRTGRILYPAFARKHVQVLEVLSAELGTLIQRVGLKGE